MSRPRVLTVSVADLLRRPGQRRHESIDAVLDGLQVLGSQVPLDAAVHVEVDLESLNEGMVVKGTAEAPWVGECRRCLGPVKSKLRTGILEVYEAHPTEGETQLLEGTEIDLEPVVREAVLLELPLAPLCRHDCAGLCPRCGADRNEVPCGCGTDDPDPRWAGLEGLRFEE